MKKTLRDYFYVLFGNGFARCAAFINSIIIARWLGPEEFGRFTIFYITMVLTWEIPQACDHTFIRFAKTSNDGAEKSAYLRTAIFLKLMYAFLICCMAYPLAHLLSHYAFQKPDVLRLVVSGLACGVFISFLLSVATVFQEREQFGRYAILPSFLSVSILLILLSLIVSGNLEKLNHTKGIVTIYLGVASLLGVVSIALLLRKTGKLFPVNMDLLKESFSFGKWILGVTIAYYLFQRIDVFTLTRYNVFKEVGIYFVAIQPIMIISLLMGSISGIFLPKAMNAVKSRDALRTHAKESLITVLIPIAGIIVLMIIAPYFIKIFYGKQYAAAGGILRVLLVGWLFLSVYLPFSFLFYALKDSRTRFVLELVKLFTAVLLLLYFVPLMGTYGAAVSITIALVLNTLLSFAVLWFKLNNKIELRKGLNVINTDS